MIEGILGNYLVETGKMTSIKLKNAMVRQNDTRVKLGLIAVAEGYMTTEQAEEVNKLQTTMDKRYGDIAVEKGYLTDDQVGELLKKQGNAYLSFIQTLIDTGNLQMDEVDSILSGIKDKYGLSDEELELMKADDSEKIVPLLMPKETQEFSGIVTIMINTLIRMIDRYAFIKDVKVVEGCPKCEQVSQAMEGENGIVDVLSEVDGGLITCACFFGQEDFIDVDEDSLDAAAEFLNITNGLYVSDLSKKGHFLELMPPCYEPISPKGPVFCEVTAVVRGLSLHYTVAAL